MFASFLIIAFSLVLLVYWFRYSCILLLRERRAADTVGTGNARFGFSPVVDQASTGNELDSLHRSLNRDYQIFIYLVGHASGLSLQSFEDRLLLLDYRVMRWWYNVTKTAFPGHARRALAEMGTVLNVLVHRISQQAGVYLEA